MLLVTAFYILNEYAVDSGTFVLRMADFVGEYKLYRLLSHNLCCSHARTSAGWSWAHFVLLCGRHARDGQWHILY
jgi:hypothetical protein